MDAAFICRDHLVCLVLLSRCIFQLFCRCYPWNRRQQRPLRGPVATLFHEQKLYIFSSLSAGMTIPAVVVFSSLFALAFFVVRHHFPMVLVLRTLAVHLPSADTTPCLKSKTMRRNLNKLLNLLFRVAVVISIVPSFTSTKPTAPPPPLLRYHRYYR